MAGAKWSEAKIAQRHRDGFGTGERSNYKPWLTYSDAGYRGNTSQPPARGLGRQMLFLSNVERDAFYVAERDPRLRDFREQFPMDRNETIDIATMLGIDYPRYRYTSVLAVLTIDALVDWEDSPTEVLDCKSTARFLHMRAKDLRAITSVYAQRRAWVMKCFTEKSFPFRLVQNLEWMREGMDDEGELCVPWNEVTRHRAPLFRQIRADLARGRKEPIDHYLARYEHDHGLPPNLTLIVLRRLLHEYCLDFDTENISYRTLLVGPLARLAAVRAPARN